MTTTTSALTPSPTTLCAETTPPRFVKQLVLAKNTTPAIEPVDVTEVFTPAQDKFHAVVSFADAPAATHLKAVWYLVETGDALMNAKLDENENEVTGTGSIDFTLMPVERAWLAGSYCVQIYVNGRAALSKRFTVREPPTTRPAPVVEVVLATDAAPNTFQPVNPTRVFATTMPVIHCIVQIQDAAPNTHFRVRWLLPNDKPQEFALTTQGSRRLDFTLKSPGGRAFDKGAYQVELYVNDVLDRTEKFTVQ